MRWGNGWEKFDFDFGLRLGAGSDEFVLEAFRLK